MQGNNQNSGGQKQTGLSWTQPASSGGQGSSNVKSNTTTNAGQAKPSSAPSVARASAMSASAATPRLAGTFIAGLLVGGLLTWMLVSIGGDGTGNITGSSATSTNSTTGQNNTISSGAISTMAGFSLSVRDQEAGSQVSVESVEVSEPTWVVVYDSVDGEPGRALGAKMFFPANNGADGVVRLLRPTIAGEEYLIGGRVDNGDRQFDGATDAAVVNQAGNRILIEFQAE